MYARREKTNGKKLGWKNSKGLELMDFKVESARKEVKETEP